MRRFDKLIPILSGLGDWARLRLILAHLSAHRDGVTVPGVDGGHRRRNIIRPAATKVGITQHIGWHTFRHAYSSLLRANRTDIKTQELLRHASSRVTLDTYTQAVTVQKRRAQSSVIRLLQASTTAAG